MKEHSLHRCKCPREGCAHRVIYDLHPAAPHPVSRYRYYTMLKPSSLGNAAQYHHVQSYSPQCLHDPPASSLSEQHPSSPRGIRGYALTALKITNSSCSQFPPEMSKSFCLSPDINSCPDEPEASCLAHAGPSSGYRRTGAPSLIGTVKCLG